MVKWNTYTAYMTLLVVNMISVSGSNDLEVSLNDSVSIGCSPHEPMDIQWHHTGPTKHREYAYAGRKFYSPYRGRFQIANYSLLIPSVNSDDAGLYECSEEISGRQLNSVHLTVLESSPFCGSNMKSHGYVGPSTCNLEQENMTFTCAVSYNGKPPQMIWATLNDSQAFNESTCKTENGRINCSLILKADPKYDGSIFTCQSTRTSANCSTDVIRIQYFEKPHLHLVEKNISEKVNCSVKSNQILQFKWIQLQGNQSSTVVKSETLLIQNPGSYRCIVEYRIRNTNCSANGTEVFVLVPSISGSETGQTRTIASIVPWLIVVIFAAGIAIVLYRFRNKKSKEGRKNNGEEIPMLSKDGMVELENNLQKTREFLEEIIDCDFGLLDKPCLKDVLSIRDNQVIEAENTCARRNALLLNAISNKKKISQLCEALKDTGQQHIVNYIKAGGEYSSELFQYDWPLTQTEISILERLSELLDDTFDTTKLNFLLNSNTFINRRYQQLISSKSTSKDRKKALLEILRRGSLRSYYRAIKCLRESNQNHITEILETVGAIVPDNAMLEADNEDETETQIANEFTNTIMQKKLSVEQANRVLKLVRANMAGVMIA